MDLNVETSLINKPIPFSNDLLLLIFCGHEEEIANQAQRVITIRDGLIETDKLV